MDYGPMIAAHVESGADLTVGCVEVPITEASAFGVLTTDINHWVKRFTEKPTNPEPTEPGGSTALASMGIYVFNTAFLFEQLIKDADTKSSRHDFGHDIIPNVLKYYRVLAYPFRDQQTGKQAYWRDVGTVDAYWHANMELVGVVPELNLYDPEWPIWTYQEQLPPAKFVFDDDGRRGMAVDSMVSGGCLISGAVIRRSLLFSGVVIHSYADIEDSLILPNVDIGRRCRIRRAVIDKDCHLPEGTVIGENAEEDARRFSVTPDGIVLVTPEMLGQAPHHVR